MSYNPLFTVLSLLLRTIKKNCQSDKDWQFFSCRYGDPREIRTPDTLIRSQVLYPAELLGHMAGVEGLKPTTYGFGDRCSINCAIPLSVITTIK